jgi:hypothetical protein
MQAGVCALDVGAVTASGPARNLQGADAVSQAAAAEISVKDSEIWDLEDTSRRLLSTLDMEEVLKLYNEQNPGRPCGNCYICARCMDMARAAAVGRKLRAADTADAPTALTRATAAERADVAARATFRGRKLRAADAPTALNRATAAERAAVAARATIRGRKLRAANVAEAPTMALADMVNRPPGFPENDGRHY